MNRKRKLTGDWVGRGIRYGCLAGLCVANAGAVDFTIDASQSSVALSGKVVIADIKEQGAGSLTTKFGGTLKATVTDTTILFTGSSVVAAQNSGSWRPKANGDDGSDPANYGAKADAGFLGQALAAVRNVQFDVTTVAPLAITSGSFDSSSLLFQFLTNSPGALDYAVSGFLPQKGGVALAGIATNQVGATKATLVTSGDTQTLTIPINTDFFFKLLSDNDTRLTLKGQLVATRTLGGGGSTFENWTATQFPGVSDPAIVGPGADPDKDGVPNFVEFAFGLNPNKADVGFAPLQISLEPDKRTLSYIRPKGLGGVDYLLWAAASLSSSWSALGDAPTLVDLGDGTEKVVYSTSLSAAQPFNLLSVKNTSP